MELYHLALRADWDTARASGSYCVSSRGATLEEVGFIHASFPHQLEDVADRFYAEVADDLVVLVIDEEELAGAGSLVRMEPGDPHDADSPLYPHIYGPIPVSAVMEVRAAHFDEQGAFHLDPPE